MHIEEKRKRTILFSRDDLVEGRRVMDNSVRLAGTFTSPHVYPQALMQDGQVNILITFFERVFDYLWRLARWRLALAGSWSPILDKEEIYKAQQLTILSSQLSTWGGERVTRGTYLM